MVADRKIELNQNETSPILMKNGGLKVGYWGYHLILDCSACDKESIKDRFVIASFLTQLVRKIDMRVYGKPSIEHFASHDPNAVGYSMIQLIETSSITGHFCDNTGDAYIDIFSCKPFSIERAQDVVREFFSPEQIKVTYLTRQA